MRSLFLTIAVSTFLGSQAQASETLNLLIWENYIDRTILSEWTGRTGIDVNEVFFDNGDSRDEVLSDPSSGIDLVVLNENGTRVFGRQGLLQQIDASNVASASEYDPHWLDRCAGYGIPYLWGTMGILYRTDRIEEVPTSWHDIIEPRPDFFGHIAMFNDTNETFVAPLITLGASINSGDHATLRQAFDLLKKQAPAVVTYDYVMTSSQNPDYGEDIWMALGYSGDQHALNAQLGTPGRWGFAFPKEGSLFWVDCLGVSSSSSDAKKLKAFDLINHIAGRTSALRNALTLTMPTANREALAMLPGQVRNDVSLYPPAHILALSQMQEVLSAEAVQTRRRIINALVNFRDPR